MTTAGGGGGGGVYSEFFLGVCGSVLQTLTLFSDLFPRIQICCQPFKMVKIDTPFQTEMAHKPYIAYITEYGVCVCGGGGGGNDDYVVERTNQAAYALLLKLLNPAYPK